MKLSSLLFLSGVFSKALASLDVGDGYARLPFDIQPKAINKEGTSKRDDYGEASLTNLKLFYTAAVKIGSQEAEQTVIIDTGSPFLWAQKYNERTSTGFDHEKSTSWTFKGLITYYFPFRTAVDSDFQKNKVTGYLGTDKVELGSMTLQNCSLAAMTEENSMFWGVLGLGPVQPGDSEYDFPVGSFMDSLYSNGIVRKRVYSLYLDTYTSANGTILFGAIDRAKFSDDQLTLFPYNYGVMELPVNEISVQGTKINNITYTAAVDAYAPYMIFPPNLLDGILSHLGARRAHWTGIGDVFAIDCPKDDSLKLSFNFDNFVIDIPVSKIVANSTREPGVCTLLFQEGNEIVLGTSFLRTVYLVVDIDNSQIGLGVMSQTTNEDIEVVSGNLPGNIAGQVSLLKREESPSTSEPSSSASAFSSSSPTLSSSALGAQNYDLPNYMAQVGTILSVIIFGLLAI